VIRVLVTGCRGQVGAEVARALAGRAEVIAHDHATLDLANRDAIAARVREAHPDVIVNGAAYTAVDRAESDEAAARAVNATGAGVLAEEAKRAGALLIHYSTDYVFDGAKAAPYVESDPTNPLNAYGRTKLEGERAIAASGAAHLILRTSWVYGPQGANFVRTMLRLAQTRDELRVVDDQRGAPTSSLQLARATLELIGGAGGAITAAAVGDAKSRAGLYHAAAAGETTWFGFAQAIFEDGPRHSRAPRLVAIPTSDYPTPARRPANSRLDSSRLAAVFGVRLGPWREALGETLSAWR
jgi:dTDP-4-dehydrorhamnose reductase